MIDFIMTNLPIIVCFVLGIGLLIVEALMPGFGIAGFSGIALEIVALVLTWQQHGTMATLGMLLIVLSVLAIAISTSLHSLTKGKLSKSSIVNSQKNQAQNRPPPPPATPKARMQATARRRTCRCFWGAKARRQPRLDLRGSASSTACG